MFNQFSSSIFNWILLSQNQTLGENGAPASVRAHMTQHHSWTTHVWLTTLLVLKYLIPPSKKQNKTRTSSLVSETTTHLCWPKHTQRGKYDDKATLHTIFIQVGLITTSLKTWM